MIGGPAGVTLFASGLLSKWGFSDGAMPDELWDVLDGLGVPWDGVEWHAVLRVLVRTYLVPALDQVVEVVDVETSHNPIRASTVDGVDVEPYWNDVDEPVELTPALVEIPLGHVLNAIAVTRGDPCGGDVKGGAGCSCDPPF